MKETTYAVVDLETTGHSPEKGDRMIQIAIVFVKNKKIVDRYSTFVQPEQPIPPFISELTSITDEDVKDAPTFDAIAKEVAQQLEGTIFVAHNTQFDLSFLHYEWERCGVEPWKGETIDTVELSKIAFPSAYSYRLQDLASQLQLPLQRAHRADDDAEATAHLLMRCYEKLLYLPTATLQQLHRRSFTLQSNVSTLFYHLLKGKRPNPVPYDVYQGIPYKKRDKKEVTNRSTLHFPATHQEKMEILQRAHPSFVRREPQLNFMDTVWASLTKGEEVVAEVPTGVGKSLGYLYPAAVYSIWKNTSVVISTYTNHLVDQLVEKEIPKVEKMVGQPLRIAILKGRNHYFSFERFLRLLETTDHSYDETLAIMQVFVWLMETDVGDLEELNVSGGGHLIIDRLRKSEAVESDDEKRADFHLRAWLEAKEAHLIFTNHAWLMSSEESATLVERAGGCIIDEAHQMIDAAIHSKEVAFSYTFWKYMIGQVHNEGEGDLLPKVLRIRSSFIPMKEREKTYIDRMRDRFVHTFEAAVERFIELALLHDTSHVREKQIVLEEPWKREKIFHETSQRLYQYIQALYLFITPVIERKEEWTKRDRAYIETWLDRVHQLEEMLDDWVAFFAENEGVSEALVLSLDTKGLPGSVRLTKRPLHAMSVIQNRLSKKARAIVWTSGTMVVRDEEQFITKQLGLPANVPMYQFEAPDSFYEGAALWIVEDMPLIQEVSDEEYVAAVVDAVVQTAYATQGRMFVLFTSQQMLKETYELLTESELLEDYIVLAQGISGGSRAKMMRSFQQWERVVLFGTTSFWEGVDIPGDSLSAVLVARLPFSSPYDPMYQKKAEAVTKRGEDTFIHYSLPEALVRFRQGFGRLIRAATDRGGFIVLDRRIETKAYGSHFIKVLPNIPVRKVQLGNMVETLETWYTEEERKRN